MTSLPEQMSRSGGRPARSLLDADGDQDEYSSQNPSPTQVVMRE